MAQPLAEPFLLLCVCVCECVSEGTISSPVIGRPVQKACLSLVENGCNVSEVGPSFGEQRHKCY